MVQNTGSLFPQDADKNCIFNRVDHRDTWRAMEKCVELGLVRSIGLSNFNSKQVQHVLDGCKIKPAVNQVIISCLQKNIYPANNHEEYISSSITF